MSIWYEKYRQKKFDDMVLPTNIEKLYKSIIEKRELPHLILASVQPGTGKTTAARIFPDVMGYESMFINASEVGGIDTLRDDVRRFCSSYSLDISNGDGKKVVILDEADNTSPQFQAAFKGFIEEFYETTRFIITCNALNKIPEPIRDRMTVIEYTVPPSEKNNLMKGMIKNCLRILDQESVTVSDKRVVAELVKRHYPNNRTILNTLQRYAKTNDDTIDEGVLSQLRGGVRADDVWSYIQKKDFKNLRACASTAAGEYSTFIRSLYDVGYNIIDPSEIPVMIECIGENQKFHRDVADLEIHVAYMFLQLMMGIKKYK